MLWKVQPQAVCSANLLSHRVRLSWALCYSPIPWPAGGRCHASEPRAVHLWLLRGCPLGFSPGPVSSNSMLVETSTNSDLGLGSGLLPRLPGPRPLLLCFAHESQRELPQAESGSGPPVVLSPSRTLVVSRCVPTVSSPSGQLFSDQLTKEVLPFSLGLFPGHWAWELLLPESSENSFALRQLCLEAEPLGAKLVLASTGTAFPSQ